MLSYPFPFSPTPGLNVKRVHVTLPAPSSHRSIHLVSNTHSNISASPLTACNPSITTIIAAINKMDSNPASFHRDSLPPQQWYVSQEYLCIDISMWAQLAGLHHHTKINCMCRNRVISTNVKRETGILRTESIRQNLWSAPRFWLVEVPSQCSGEERAALIMRCYILA